jgi:hypothetical protein
MNLTSDPPTPYSVGAPSGVNVIDVRLFLPPQGGLRTAVIGQNPSTHDSNIFIGFAATPNCVPPVIIGFGLPVIPTSAQKRDLRAGDLVVLTPFIGGVVEPVSVSLTGNVPPNVSARRVEQSLVFVTGNAPDAGDYIFTLTVTDGRGCKAQLTITLHVVGPRRVVPTMKFIPGKIKVPRAPR